MGSPPFAIGLSWYCTAALVFWSMAGAAVLAHEDGKPPGVPRCEVAVVSPVSGAAECVKPRGVAVDPPPPRPPLRAEDCAKHADLDLKECREQSTPKAPAE